MYNPSSKYQKSFQYAVEKLIEQNQNISATYPLFSSDESLIMTIIFRMKRPKLHFVNSKPGPDRLKKNAPPQTSPVRTDVDNLTKFVLDSMNQVLYDDDHQIISLHVTKLLDDGGMCDGSIEVFLQSIDDHNSLEHLLTNSMSILEKRL
jgi:Holliday junction resolvase RusA-like endonuclease